MNKLLGIIAIAAVTAAAGWNFNQSQNEVEMSELGLANVEALAQDELLPPSQYEIVYQSGIRPGPDGSPIHTFVCTGKGRLFCLGDLS